MPKHNVKSNEVITTILLNAYNVAGQSAKAVEYFRLIRSRFKVDTHMYNSAMRAYKLLGNHDEVNKLWNELCKVNLDDKISMYIYAWSLASENLIEGIKKLKLDESGWKCVVNELYERDKFETAMSCFRIGYEDGKLPVWSLTDNNTLDLHGQNTAIAHCAVAYFLSTSLREGQNESLGIIVGRQNHATTMSLKSLGESVRQQLYDMDVKFYETADGGKLVIPRREMQRLKSVKSEHVDSFS